MSVITVNNPTSREVLYSLQEAEDGEIEAAFSQAVTASCHMRRTTVAERTQCVARVLAFLQREEQQLLDAIVAETGRCRGDAMLSDLVQLQEDCHWLIQNAERVLADQKVPTPLTLLGKKSVIYHEARGVVLVISPWNLPLAIAATAALFAFVAGNAVIIKPSEHAPIKAVFEQLTSLSPLLAEAMIVVHGGGDVARKLIAHRPDMISFTGSVRTGQKILAQAAPLVIPVTVELGAKDAMIVCDDCDLERAVDAACWGTMHNSGQSCTAVERLYVQEPLFEEFVARLTEAFNNIRLGCGPDADVGGITTDFQMETIESHVQDAQDKGAVIHCGGFKVEENFYKPTVVTGVTEDMKLFREETFGPVVPVFSFSTDEEAVDLHNNCPYGLSSSVWTNNHRRAGHFARVLVSGCVNINNIMLTEGNASLPFGGVKMSGHGRIKGAEGLLGMTQSKAVLFDNTRGKPEPNWYPYSSRKLGLMSQLMLAVTRSDGLGKLMVLAKLGWALDRLVKEKK